MTTYLRDKPRDKIVNCDETCWLVLPKNLLTWTRKGVESVYITPEQGGAEKDRITVHASISAEGRKLPLLFIAEGKTRSVEDTQIGHVGGHWRVHTKNGWQTEENFTSDLRLLRVHIGGGQDAVDRVYLSIDLYTAHWTEQVRETAEELNIEMVPIPASSTDELQPLDRKVFAPLKAKAKHEYQMGRKRGNKRGKMQACQEMIKVWDELKEHVIRSGWAHIIPEYQAELGKDEGDIDSEEERDDGRWNG
jgi:hypothetical protein